MSDVIVYVLIMFVAVPILASMFLGEGMGGALFGFLAFMHIVYFMFVLASNVMGWS